MKPCRFPEANRIMGENQLEYQPLPAFVHTDGTVVSCWRLSFWERLRVLFTGRVWSLTLTFKRPLQPQLLQTNRPFGPLPAPVELAAKAP